MQWYAVRRWVDLQRLQAFGKTKTYKPSQPLPQFHLIYFNTNSLLKATRSTWGARPLFMPGLKGPPVASSNRVVRPTVRVSVRNSFIWSAVFKVWTVIQERTWYVRSSKGCSDFTYITCPLGWGGSMFRTWVCQILSLFSPGVTEFHKRQKFLVVGIPPIVTVDEALYSIAGWVQRELFHYRTDMALSSFKIWIHESVLTLDQQWLPYRSDFPPISWP